MFKKIGSTYNHLEEILLVLCILIMVVVIFLQVVMRYAFNSSLSWSEELARILFIWASWIGISFGQKRSDHIKIVLLTDNLKGKFKDLVLFVADLCTLGILLVLLVKGMQITDKIYSMASITPALSIPKWIMYASVPLSCSLMSIRVVKEMVLRITGRNYGEVAQ
ncbi:MAG TPA: TRAP transporter small permease [Anaerovoracaceae bacterium]|nr:TRAP transporter small permease [Anaerovoracaceae bacterium]